MTQQVKCDLREKMHGIVGWHELQMSNDSLGRRALYDLWVYLGRKELQLLQGSVATCSVVISECE